VDEDKGEGGALGGAESLALHFGELSKVNGRAEGGVRGGMVLCSSCWPGWWGAHRRTVTTWWPQPDAVGHNVVTTAPFRPHSTD
jgi:hypothetical protein